MNKTSNPLVFFFYIVLEKLVNIQDCNQQKSTKSIKLTTFMISSCQFTTESFSLSDQRELKFQTSEINCTYLKIN